MIRYLFFVINAGDLFEESRMGRRHTMLIQPFVPTIVPDPAERGSLVTSDQMLETSSSCSNVNHHIPRMACIIHYIWPLGNMLSPLCQLLMMVGTAAHSFSFPSSLGDPTNQRGVKPNIQPIKSFSVTARFTLMNI